MDGDEVQDAVRMRYAQYAVHAHAEDAHRSGTPMDMEGHADAAYLGYEAAEVESVPEEANLGLGCGAPLSALALHRGSTVLDMGCGGGMDCLIAAQRVGAEGRVIGVDMTPEMVDLARANVQRSGCDNVEIRLGRIEDMPVAGGSVDYAISNCVLNLVPDKQAAFSEAFRVLKPGGAMAVSDIVVVGKLPRKLGASMAQYVDCLGGAITLDGYRSYALSAGFETFEVLELQHIPRYRCWASMKAIIRKPCSTR